MSLRFFATVVLASALAPLSPIPAQAANPTPMAAHRAMYELTLDKAMSEDVAAARGSMAYDVSDACDGWATRQRLDLVVTNREGQDIHMVSDYTTWESKDGLSMRFRMKQTTDDAVSDQAEGDAHLESRGGTGTIHYTVPEEKETAMPRGTLFPMTHTEAILDGASEGKKFLSLPLFDGTGSKGAQDTSVVILGWNPPGAAPYPALEGLSSGRVHIAFFDRGVAAAAAGATKPAGSPDYEVSMKYWANGVADGLHMTFSDFVMNGRLKEFAVPAPHC